MSERVRIFGDILVLILIGFPPFLYLYRYTCDRVKNKLLRLILYILYWGGTALVSHPVPALLILFLIYESKRQYQRLESYDEEDIIIKRFKYFNLDCSGDKWRFSLSLFLKVALLGILIKYIVSYVNYLFIELLKIFNVILENQEIVDEFLNSNLWSGSIYFIIIVICAPIVEEFVFRFWIYDRLLKPRMNFVFAAILTNLLFMSAHFNIQGAISFFLIGVINCYLYDKKGYWAAVSNHFMFNFISIVFLIIIRTYNIPIEP